MKRCLAVLFGLSIGSCTASNPGIADGGDAGDAGAEAQGDADAGPSSLRLISSSYSVPAFSEMWQCERVNVTADVWVTRFTPNSPPGTHHEVLAIDPTPTATGTSNCSISIERDWTVLFASGVGSPSLDMPPGVAFRIPAGSQIVLDLHLLNATSSAIVGTSSIDVQTALPADVQNEAQVILVGPVLFNVPPGPNQMANGACTLGGPTNYFAVFPHMHQLGTHIRVDASVSGVTQTVYDMDYFFTDQQFVTFPPIAMGNGDRVVVDCTYDNTTGATVSFGESSYDEMCFAISYFYPVVSYPTFGSFGASAICAY